MLRWSGLVARLVVGGIWIYAGALKLPDPEGSITAVRAYQLLPRGLADVVGRGLPTVELLLGACLVLGVLVRWSGLLSGLLLVAFIVGISSVWARGISIDCGCFGDGGADPDAISAYPWEIARDAGLLLLSAFLAWRPRTALAADSVLFPGAARPDGAPTDEESHVEEVR